MIEGLKTASSLLSLADRLVSYGRRVGRSRLVRRWIQAIVIFWGILSLLLALGVLYCVLVGHCIDPGQAALWLALFLGLQGAPMALLGGEVGRLRADRNQAVAQREEQRRERLRLERDLESANRVLLAEREKWGRFLEFVDTKLRDWMNMVVGEADEEAAETVDLRELYLWVQDVLCTACELVGPDDLERACVYRPTFDGQELRIWADVGLRVESYERNVFSLTVSDYITPGAATWVYLMKTVKVMDSWEDDEHYRRLRPRREPTPYSGSLIVPILTPFNDENNRCLGVLCIDKVSPARFNASRDVSTAVAVGRFLIVAMMMYDQVRPGWTGERWW